MSVKKRQTFLGAALIVLGALLFLDELDVIDYSWPWILVIAGAAFLANFFSEKNHGSVFVGTLLLLLGLAFLAEDGAIPGIYISELWPFLVMAPGGAFIASYFADRSRAGELTTGIILLVIGGYFALIEEHVLRGRFFHRIGDWWPLLLLGFGVYLILQPRRGK